MYFVYFLQNLKTKRTYIGYTRDLRKRFKQHSASNANWQLIYYEAYRNEKDAKERERKLKERGNAVGHLKNRIKRSML